MGTVLSTQRKALQTLVEGVCTAQAGFNLATTIAFNPIDYENQLLILDTNLPLAAVYLVTGKQTRLTGGRGAGGKSDLAAGWGIAIVVDLAAQAQHGIMPNYEAAVDELTDLIESIMVTLDGRTDFARTAGVTQDLRIIPVANRSGSQFLAAVISGYESKETIAIAAD